MTTRGTGPADSLEPSPGRGSKMLGGRAVLVSSVSTVLFFAVVAAIVVLAPGSEIVAERFFDPFHLRQSFFGTESEPSVVGAFLLNVDRKSTRLNSSHANISYAVFCLKKKTQLHHI